MALAEDCVEIGDKTYSLECRHIENQPNSVGFRQAQNVLITGQPTHAQHKHQRIIYPHSAGSRQWEDATPTGADVEKCECAQGPRMSLALSH